MSSTLTYTLLPTSAREFFSSSCIINEALDAVPSRINPNHIFMCHLIKLHFKTVLSLTCSTGMWNQPFMFSDRLFMYFSFTMLHVPYVLSPSIQMFKKKAGNVRINITLRRLAHSECVSVALVTQHAMRMRRIILSHVDPYGSTIFCHIILRTARFSGKSY